MALDLVVESDLYELRIYFGGLLHLHILRPILAFHSWRENSKYFIEYTLPKGAVVQTEYDSLEKWQALLRELDTHLK